MDTSSVPTARIFFESFHIKNIDRVDCCMSKNLLVISQTLFQASWRSSFRICSCGMTAGSDRMPMIRWSIMITLST